MNRNFEKHISHHFPFLEGKKLLVAISGGVDSVVLTHLLHRLHCKIALAHCNFSLRNEESDKDELFVKKLARELDVAVYTVKFNTSEYAQKKGISTQMAARDLRYNWFQEICKTHKFDYILTAHHSDDALETFLINLTRGTGIDGLSGIPQKNENIIRPLLSFSRNNILDFALANKLHWREDKSNASTKYTRNKIRHEVIPVLKEINPNLLNSFQKTLDNLHKTKAIAKDAVEIVKKQVVSTSENEITFSIKHLKKLKNAPVYLFELLKEYGFTEWNDVANLLDAQSGKQLFSKTHRLLKNRTALLLTEITSNNKQEYTVLENVKEIYKPIGLKFEKIIIPFDTKKHQNKIIEELISTNNSVNTALLDYNSLTFPLVIRKWQIGDYFYPLGLKGKKKVSKYFKDEQFSLIDKEHTWLLCSKNAIVWIIGKRLDNRFKVTPKSSSILKITISH